jgi:hypothetical protein
MEINPDIEGNTVWKNSELKFAFVTGLETLLSSTALVAL